MNFKQNKYLQEIKLFHTEFKDNFKQYKSNLLKNIQSIKNGIKDKFLERVKKIFDMNEQCFQNLNNEAYLSRMLGTSKKNLFDYNLKSLNLNYTNFWDGAQFTTDLHKTIIDIYSCETISKDYYYSIEANFRVKDKRYKLVVNQKLDDLYKSDQLPKINYKWLY